VTHLRLDVFPDGGTGRFRVHGTLTDEGARQLVSTFRAALPLAHAEQIDWSDVQIDWSDVS
jgi:allantoicase